MLMRKFTLLLLAAVMAVTVGAQPQMVKKTLGSQKPAAAFSMTRMPAQQLSVEGLQHEQPMPSAAPIMKAGSETELVVPPADLVTERYRMNGYIQITGWEPVNRPILIGFDGNDVYLQGFMYYLPEAWIKGTLSEDHSKVTFPMQFVGNLVNSNGELRDVYFWPGTSTDNGWECIDAVFNYNEEVGTFVLQQDVVTYIFENTLVDGLRYFAVYDSVLNITDDSDTVEAPDDLVVEDYQFTATMMECIDEEAGEWTEYEDIASTVKVGFDGDDVYVQGLCSYIPGAWIKGKRQGSQFVFENGQYFGTYIYIGEGYPIYLVGFNTETSKAEDLVMDFDEETGTLTARQWVSLSAIPDDAYYYEIYSNVVISHISDVAAMPATPEILYFEYDPDYEMALAELDVPAMDVDGRSLITSKLSYQLFTDYGEGVEPYVFEADWHDGLSEDMSIVPYDFEDNIDFLRGGEMILFYGITDGLKRIGVKSIYTGGEETNETEINWYLVDEDYVPDETITGIAQANSKTNTQVLYFDLQGRQTSATSKGLLMKQTRKADGSVSTVKVMR